MTKQRSLLFLLLLVCSGIASGQDMWKYFTPEDFASRRARVIAQIGDGVAILQGAELTEAYIKFRQDNNFYYLTGVEIPNAVLVLNGKTKMTTLYVPDNIPNDIKAEAMIKPGKEAADLYKFSRVASKTALVRDLGNMASQASAIWVMTSPEETMEMSRDRCMAIRTARINDPLDGRISKEANFMNKIRENFPIVAFKSLTPILDEMRWVKDKKEIAVLRECGKIGARGFDEAMRVTRPGIYEYQVVAACDFIYQDAGQANPAYFAIAASGEQGLSWHYNANNHLLKSGDVILLDYAPELNYYTTDITRTWPVEGKFTDVQLKMYNCIKETSEKVIAAMKPGVILDSLVAIQKAVFKKHGYEKLALNGVGHYVGMAVHDVGPYNKPLVPGVVFNVEPIIEDKDLKLHLRLEDTIIITETGHENVTAATTTVVDTIYKIIKEKGVGEK